MILRLALIISIRISLGSIFVVWLGDTRQAGKLHPTRVPGPRNPECRSRSVSSLLRPYQVCTYVYVRNTVPELTLLLFAGQAEEKQTVASAKSGNVGRNVRPLLGNWGFGNAKFCSCCTTWCSVVSKTDGAGSLGFFFPSLWLIECYGTHTRGRGTLSARRHTRAIAKWAKHLG